MVHSQLEAADSKPYLKIGCLPHTLDLSSKKILACFGWSGTAISTVLLLLNPSIRSTISSSARAKNSKWHGFTFMLSSVFESAGMMEMPTLVRT